MQYEAQGEHNHQRFSPDKTGEVRVLQFSDIHLYEDSQRTLLGLNTGYSFANVLELAKQQHWPPDLVLVTGDLVHNGSAAAYKKLQTYLGALQIPVFCLPGNHDKPLVMHQTLQGANIHTDNRVRVGQWEILLLDSTIPGSDGGRLSTKELDKLAHLLEQCQDRPVLIALHHPPMIVGSRWLDSMTLENPQALFSIVDRYPNVRAILCGHIHQEFNLEYKGVKIMAAPSTCIQFKPQCDDFTVDSLAPGYRWLSLNPVGTFVTGVNRLERLPSNIDMAASGY